MSIQPESKHYLSQSLSLKWALCPSQIHQCTSEVRAGPWIMDDDLLGEAEPRTKLEGLMLKLKLQYFGHLM